MRENLHVVIVGGGFGGLSAAHALGRAPVRVTLLDRRNFHLFQPLLYQVATGGLSPANIASPLRKIFRRQRNVRVLLGEVRFLDASRRSLGLGDGELTYDSLILATGSEPHYFGHDHWAGTAPGLKTLEDATEIRRRMLLAFERAERASDPREIRAFLTFVIVGAGATGVELAGAIGEITRDTLRRDFRRIDPATTQILLVEGSNRVLPPFVPELSTRAARSLKRLGVTVRTEAMVDDILEDRVILRTTAGTEVVPTRSVFWAAGVKASPFGETLRTATRVELDRDGRVMVSPDLSVPGHREIFVIGDLAHVETPAGNTLPGVAPVAIQEGRYVARLIQARLEGKTRPPFRYRDRGSMATIGRAAAVADIAGVRFAGYPAWLAWLFIHLIQLIGFDNKVLVLFQWAWNYITFNRGARLITGRLTEDQPWNRPPLSPRKARPGSTV